jgi:co-chaperonin GroES (HSP10)
MKVNPLSDYIVARAVEEESSFGFKFPESATKEKVRKATVISVGPGNGDYIMTSKPGDLLMINENRSIKFKLNGEELLMLREQDCFFSITED